MIFPLKVRAARNAPNRIGEDPIHCTSSSPASCICQLESWVRPEKKSSNITTWRRTEASDKVWRMIRLWFPMVMTMPVGSPRRPNTRKLSMPDSCTKTSPTIWSQLWKILSHPSLLVHSADAKDRRREARLSKQTETIWSNRKGCALLIKSRPLGNIGIRPSVTAMLRDQMNQSPGVLREVGEW